MGSDYQTRKDIDQLLHLHNTLQYIVDSKENISSIEELIQSYYDKSEIDTKILQKLGLDQSSADKFNYAIINKTIQEGGTEVTYEEFWIMANAYYDYGVGRFVKIDTNSNSFGIQIQARGTYPGEQQLGYIDNTSIGVWRNPKSSDVYKDTSVYDYSDFDNLHHMGAKRLSDDEWVEFGIACGWNNNLMIDSYGGITIGGSGFEVDGNGIFPYTRLTSSKYTVNSTTYYLLGLLDNAYHSLSGCDNNNTYSWFVGLRMPEASYNTKDNVNASFVVMYNDTAYNSSNIHYLDNTKWHVVFEVNTNGVV